ncbi:T9SS type B sorting domain-containing protein [Gillisia sp. M10.2A]|uniref:T9SS type B sorting domain-containing protein n=1 Tax=Gillisia lutea TaxID=2909668 RepID=A0ABS9EEU8_9FLAO|nr:T9SS type B sorting domain-containing protein [Gillisia lutea]MCF4101323.1 T9SS type B sorting domain-containing protein [Gillisia lutea]
MKTRNFLLLFVLVLIGNITFAQKETSNWYFGDGAGLSFNSGNPVALNGGRVSTIEGSASISDRNGNLLFYTDGITVFDRSHNSMLNGSGLKGNVSSTQSAIIIPKPAYPGIYYIFTVDKPDYFNTSNDPIEGINYSEVDMSLNGGLGGVVPDKKNIPLITYNPSNSLENEFKSSEKISAVISGDCVSYWVVTQFTNKFYAFNVSSSGVNTSPVISTISNNFSPLLNEQNVNVTAGGYLKISPDGKKMAAAYTGTSLGSPRTGGAKSTGKLFLYDFNDVTGRVSNEQLLLTSIYPYGVEFSPKTSKLYLTANIYNSEDRFQNSELYQFDLKSSNIPASVKTIHTSRNVAGALQLAIDGKIYRAGYPTDDGGYIEYKFLSVIKDPEEIAANINYSHNSVSVEPNDVKLGLPPFIQSLFNSDFDIENLCFGDTTKFIISGQKDYDTVMWDFGDGSTSISENPTHVYSSSGVFTVVLTKTLNGIPLDPVCKEIIIVEIPAVPNNYELSQCDTQDSDPTDGFAEFNLQLARDYFTNASSNLQIFFYKTRQNAIDDELNQNALNNFYRNTSLNEVIYAKVTGFGSSCYNISELTLKTTKSEILKPSPATGCDLGDGTAEYNLYTIENNIKEELNLGASIELTFFESEDDAIRGVNPVPEIFTTAPETIYIRATDNGKCYGFGEMTLTLIPFPDISPFVEVSICSSELPVVLGTNISLPNESDYDFKWSTGETSKTITVTNDGSYSLKITKSSLGCGKLIEYNVNILAIPEITDIKVESVSGSNIVEIFTNSVSSESLFALDRSDGHYQTSSIFSGVTPGIHTVFAKNSSECGLVQEEIIVFGFPIFFTPNNDGYNDLWKPITDAEYGITIQALYIYDRYGKLIKQLDPDGPGWNGTYNGKDMPSDDYWFKATIQESNQIFNGHFTLKR